MAAADELAALLSLDALEPLEQADAELQLGDFPTALRQVSAALAERTATAPPNGLRGDTLALARRRRRPGNPLGAVAASPPGETFARTVDDVHDLLTALTDDEWLAEAHADHGRVRTLVAHLIGMERLSARWLDPDDTVPPVPDHLSATDDAVAELAGVPARELADRWYAAARKVARRAADGDPAREVPFHEMVTDVAGHLTIRTFELWAHSTDISLATGRATLRLDDARMATLSSRFLRVAPLALLLSGRTRPGRTVRFVLTGPAGGTYDLALSPRDSPDDPDAVVVTDPLELCRLAARRLHPDDLVADVEGDRDLARSVLGGLSALARD